MLPIMSENVPYIVKKHVRTFEDTLGFSAIGCATESGDVWPKLAILLPANVFIPSEWIQND